MMVNYGLLWLFLLHRCHPYLDFIIGLIPQT